ncbi:hypothetical protein [Thiolapillus sp.]
MSQLLQSNQLAGMDGRRVQGESVQPVSTLGASALHATQIAGSSLAGVTPGLHRLSMEQGSLQAASVRSGTGLFDETSRRLSERRRQDKEAGADTGSGREQKMIPQMEFEACRTIIQVALMIQQQGMFSNFLIVNFYQDKQHTCASASEDLRQMVVVAGLDEPGRQVPVHATLVWLDVSGKPLARRLPGQLVWGRRSFAADWVAMHLEQEAETGIWRLHGQGFRDQLAGVALATGDIPAFAGSWADVSLHMPGAARYWVGL